LIFAQGKVKALGKECVGAAEANPQPTVREGNIG
jgi:hypothetical protein